MRGRVDAWAPQALPAGPAPKAPQVSARRPLGYVVAGSVLALASLLLPGGASRAEGPAPALPPPPVAATAPCDGVVQSLRPGPLPAAGAMPAGTTMAQIAQRGRLIAAVDQGKYGLAFRDPTTGELQGADIDVVRAIATAIFGDPGRVQYVVVNVADREEVVENGDADVTVNTFTVTCERQRQVSFSAPYLDAAPKLLVPKGSGVAEIEDLSGRTVCASVGSTTVPILQRYAGVEIVTRPGIPDCMVDLQAGRVQAVSNDDVILAGLAAQDPQTEVVGRPLADGAQYAVGVRRGDDAMVRFVNGVLERARAEDSLAQSYRTWFTGVLDPLPQPAAPVYRD